MFHAPEASCCDGSFMSAFGYRGGSGGRVYPKAGGGGEWAHEARHKCRHSVSHQKYKYGGYEGSSEIQIGVLSPCLVL